MLEGLKPISSINTDYWQWGKNCQILEKSSEEFTLLTVGDIVDTAIKYYNATKEDIDLFWEGYYSCEK